MKSIFGVIALIIGTAIFGGIGYELATKGQRGFHMGALPAVGVASAMVFCGVKWLRANGDEESPAKDTPYDRR